MKIYISPSSQESNVWNDYVEEVQMNKVADILCPELTRHGVDWKRNDRSKTFKEHIIESNAYAPDYHLAIHSNARGGHGCTSFCYHPLVNNKGTQFATHLFNEIVAISPWPGRGVSATDMWEVTKTTAPACLIEVEFHDNLQGSTWIMTHISEIALALLKGILKQMNIAYIPPIDYKTLFEATKSELDQAKIKIALYRNTINASIAELEKGLKV